MFKTFRNKILQKVSRVRETHHYFARAKQPYPKVPRDIHQPDIICFSVIPWDLRYQRPQQMMSRFGQHGQRVFYIHPVFLHNKAVTQVQPVSKNVFELQLPGIKSVNIYKDWLTEPALSIALKALRAFLAQVATYQATIIVQHPFWFPLAKMLKSEYGWKVIYDCMDVHSAFEGTSAEIDEMETHLLEISDMVAATAKHLKADLDTKHSTVISIPNATDYEHFSQLPARRQSPIATKQQPIIGYYGAIAEWFDQASVLHAAQQHPDWTFVCIGHVSNIDVSALDTLANVIFVGEIPYKTLPEYLTAFDVCTIPFQKTPLTDSTNPVKLFEYLSSGKPVVARRLPELEEFENIVELYETPEEFAQTLEKALSTNNADKQQERQQVAQQNTWQQRIEMFEFHLNLLYAKASIIIVTYNNLDYTRLNIENILNNTLYPNYEIIIVDNSSHAELVDYLQEIETKHAHINVIFNTDNLGFAAANNIGLEQTQDSEYIVLLNDDVVVTKGWLSGLIRYLQRPDVGLVGPVTNATGNEAQIPVPYKDDLEAMSAFAAQYTAAHHDAFLELDMLAMYCLGMRRNVYEEIGPLDTRFGVGMFEDDDYSMRVKTKGYKIICTEAVFVHHFWRASFSKLNDSTYQRLFEQNKHRFEQKWQQSYKPHKQRAEFMRIQKGNMWKAIYHRFVPLEQRLRLRDFRRRLMGKEVAKRTNTSAKNSASSMIYQTTNDDPVLKPSRLIGADPFDYPRPSINTTDTFQTLADRIHSQVSVYKEPAYLQFYDELFAPIRDRELNFFEIGLYKGGSFLMFAEYFQQARLLGIDIERPADGLYQALENDQSLQNRTKIALGSQDDVAFMDTVLREFFADKPVDIIIDDASHLYNPTATSFSHLFVNWLRPGGIYIIEDWGAGYWPKWPDGNADGMHGLPRLVKELVDEIALRDRTLLFEGKRTLDVKHELNTAIERMIVRPSITVLFKKR